MNNFSTYLDYQPPSIESQRRLNNQASVHIRIPERNHDAFQEASSVLESSATYDDPAQNAAATLEASRAIRTRGLLVYIGKYRLHARIPHNGFDPVSELETSKTMTETLLGLDEDQSAQGLAKSIAAVKEPSLKEATREIMANHAQTLSYLARIATREQVVNGTINASRPLSPADKAIVTEKERYYGRNYAHGFAVLGNKPDVIVENAMYGARAEVLMGGFRSKLRAAIWLGRATRGLIRSAIHTDRQLTLGTLKLAMAIAPSLQSKDKAIMAIRKDV
jgi:hypothetical protein